MTNAGRPWSVPVALEDIPETGLHLAIEAPDAVRAEVAKLAGLRDLPKFGAVFDLTRSGAGLHVSGQASARVGQTCVVTLEPIENAIEETIDLDFAPSAAVEGKGRRQRTRDDDAPEPLVDGSVDLGQLATEFLILGIDPYPRKPGAAFAAPQDADTGEHPFAALESLKKTLGGPKT
jgi:uncharacterized metal-binding protein YceD (DUF177 family)